MYLVYTYVPVVMIMRRATIVVYSIFWPKTFLTARSGSLTEELHTQYQTIVPLKCRFFFFVVYLGHRLAPQVSSQKSQFVGEWGTQQLLKRRKSPRKKKRARRWTLSQRACIIPLCSEIEGNFYQVLNFKRLLYFGSERYLVRGMCFETMRSTRHQETAPDGAFEPGLAGWLADCLSFGRNAPATIASGT